MTANDIIQRNAECARRLLEAGAEIERLQRSIEIYLGEITQLRADNELLRSLLQELIDIEGPQPGTSEWANKVRRVLGPEP